MPVTLQQLAESLQLDYQGDGTLEIESVASLRSATAGDLCFIQQEKYLRELADSSCTAVILPPALATEAGAKAVLLADEAYYQFVRAIEILGLVDDDEVPPGIHASAQVASSASIGDGVSVGALAIIGDDVEIGAGSTIGAGSIFERGARLGNNSHIHPRVTLGHDVIIGDRCILQPGVVIGGDGFGLLMHEEQWVRVPHLGSVVIEDDVEIGANTTIDRGALDDTLIERGCKLDNLIQVAHNVRIGEHTAIAACVGIAGSATIGRYCKISGAAVVLGHLSIADHVTVTAMSLVTKDIRQAGVYSSGTPLLENGLWHRNNVRYKALDKLAQTVARLEKKKV